MEVLENSGRSHPRRMTGAGSWSPITAVGRAAATSSTAGWTARDDKFWGSYSDAYGANPIEDTGGASNAIARTIAVGQANTVVDGWSVAADHWHGRI